MTPPQPSWYEHVDLMQVLIVGLLGYFVYTWREGIKDFKHAIQDLYEKYNNLNAEMNELKGEHKARKGSCE